MKTIFRFLSLSLVLAVFTAVGVTTGFAQDDPCTDTAGKADLDKKFRDNYAGDVAGREAAKRANKPYDVAKDLPQRKIAVEAGKQYIEKYGSCEPDKDIVAYYKTNLPAMEERIKKDEEIIRIKALETRFNTSLTAGNWDEVYASGKELLAINADVYRPAILVFGSIGLDEMEKKVPPVTKYNDETLKYAKMAIQDLEANKTFKTYGVKPFIYDNKEDALGWMNYTIGYITAYGQKNKKEAAQYFYKASQSKSNRKDHPVVYEGIGLFYDDEVAREAAELQTLIANESPKEGDTPEVVAKKDAAIKQKTGMLNGYIERAIDAYARAHKLVGNSPDPKAKKYKDDLRKRMETLYKVRGKQEGLDTFISSLVSKPMPNPTTAVTPIIDPEVKPEVTTTTTSTTPPTTTPAGATTTKPVTTPVKPASTTTKPETSLKGNGTSTVPAATTTATKAKTVKKKSVAKRKGTR